MIAPFDLAGLAVTNNASINLTIEAIVQTTYNNTVAAVSTRYVVMASGLITVYFAPEAQGLVRLTVYNSLLSLAPASGVTVTTMAWEAGTAARRLAGARDWIGFRAVSY